MITVDVASVSSARINMQQSQVRSTAQTKMLHNSMDQQAQAAQKIMQAIPQNQTVLNPSYLGRNIDTRA
jgi:hypothetical protein